VIPTSAADERPTNPYLSKYAGGYTVQVLGVSTPSDAEAFILHENGNAKWMWLKDDGHGGAKKVSEKTGTWIAEENKIIISIDGNTGTITEVFVMKRGIFTETMRKRYLERTR